MGIGSILSGIGAASSILGGLSGNKQKAMPGAQIRSMEEQLSEMDKLRAYLEQNMSYNPRPTRRLTAAELEGPFAPVAVREIQNYFDYKYPSQSTDGGEQENQSQSAMLAQMADLLEGREAYNAMRGRKGGSWRPEASAISNQVLADYGRELRKNPSVVMGGYQPLQDELVKALMAIQARKGM